MKMEVDMQVSTNQMDKTESEVVKKKGITGSTLKMIAIITMLIDHIGAVILERIAYKDVIEQIQSGETVNLTAEMINMSVYNVDMIIRSIGRLGFPIFCFLLIEGFTHTRNMKKYAGRLFLFALISEIPFNLAIAGEVFFPKYQNVFFTLLIGILVLIGFRYVEEKKWNKAVSVILHLVILAVGMFAATWLKTDYKYIGVLTVAIMYIFRKRKLLAAGMGCATLTAFMLNEITAFFTLIPIHMYNGKRGWNMKWVFYIFYPAHLLLLYLIACALGYGSVSLGIFF